MIIGTCSVRYFIMTQHVFFTKALSLSFKIEKELISSYMISNITGIMHCFGSCNSIHWIAALAVHDEAYIG